MSILWYQKSILWYHKISAHLQQMIVDAEILYILWYYEIDYAISILWS